ncbi:hypothetical protein [Arthrobacter sp. MMS18-M83]|uniref:hypothetical protein n=1 Tax=Arthrobacter sp. MMS18-M83 TaxID=2996261 RepID=UPI00227D427F|nr:hypothetical protein [Arthrobacter sp. MMS18-M83]WAH96578.1 hypothetical protein OW521_19580 [Arthrobacter sp. MMS18-M83]
MEIVGILVFIILVITAAATVSAVLRDGRGHLPPVRSEEPWTAKELPSTPYWTLRVF